MPAHLSVAIQRCNRRPLTARLHISVKMEKIIKEVILLCNPADTYKDMSETDAAKAYKRFAFEDYDGYVGFKPGSDFETPNLEAKIANKLDRPLNVTVFANKPVVRVGTRKFDIFSSSYLFNPGSSVPEAEMLPDLDVVQLKGSYADAAAELIGDFYELEGWQVDILDEKEKIEKVSVKGVKVLDPKELLNKAISRGYTLFEFYFKPAKYEPK